MFDAETKQLDTIPVWVHLPGLPLELWNPTWLSEIRNEPRTLIEADLSFQQTKIKKVARILVSLNIKTSLPEAFNFVWKKKIKRQLLDYEGIPFRCHKCHETRNLARNCRNFVPSTTRRRKWVRRTEDLSSKETDPNTASDENILRSKGTKQPLDQPERAGAVAAEGPPQQTEQSRIASPPPGMNTSSLSNQLNDLSLNQEKYLPTPISNSPPPSHSKVPPIQTR